MRVKLDDGAFAQERAHETEAGLDLRTPVRVVLRGHDSVTGSGARAGNGQVTG